MSTFTTSLPSEQTSRGREARKLETSKSQNVETDGRTRSFQRRASLRPAAQLSQRFDQRKQVILDRSLCGMDRLRKDLFPHLRLEGIEGHEIDAAL